MAPRMRSASASASAEGGRRSFTPARRPVGEVGQHHLLNRGHMLGGTHDRTGPIGGAAMASQHHTGVRFKCVKFHRLHP
jgi:hypothetical protein